MFFKISFIILLAVQTITAIPVIGEPAQENEFPSVVALVYNRIPSVPFCSGVLLNANTVLTAAHCTRLLQKYNLSLFHVYAGPSVSLLYTLIRQFISNKILQTHVGGYKANILSYINHPFYNKLAKAYDIAIIKLLTLLLNTSLAVSYTKLPERNLDPIAKSIITIAA